MSTKSVPAPGSITEAETWRQDLDGLATTDAYQQGLRDVFGIFTLPPTLGDPYLEAMTAHARRFIKHFAATRGVDLNEADYTESEGEQ